MSVILTLEHLLSEPGMDILSLGACCAGGLDLCFDFLWCHFGNLISVMPFSLALWFSLLLYKLLVMEEDTPAPCQFISVCSSSNLPPPCIEFTFPLNFFFFFFLGIIKSFYFPEWIVLL
jgi:hypothetical protein